MADFQKIEILCPSCKSSQIISDSDSWCCDECGAKVSKVNNVWCFAGDDAYLGTFSFQWQKHALVYDSDAEKESTERTLRKLQITPELVRGKRVLDVGCGTGRLSRMLADWGAQVVAVDLSQAVWVAQKNSADRKNMLFMHADLFNLPFPEQYFDLILAWGVLHHTPNTELAFKKVVSHLKPGGRYSVYIYGKSKGTRRRMISLYRKLTVHLPSRLLHAICYLAIPMYYVYRIPLIGNLARFLLPMSRQKDPMVRVQETFDEYSPYYAWRHTFPEVHQWFLDVGIVDNAIYDPPILATGRMSIGNENS